MSGFVEFPNLPRGRVSVAAVGEHYVPELQTELEKYGVKLLSCPKSPYIDERLSSHVDLNIYHFGGGRFLFSKHATVNGFAYSFKERGAEILVSSEHFSQVYPNDAHLCALNIGGKVFHNTRCSDRHISALAGKRLFHVNQGYAKCAVCPVTENAAISADPGLSVAMREQGIEVLEITPGFVELYGFREGFIGGAAFKLAPDILAFTGRLTQHPDKALILDFIKKHGVSAVYLTDKPVFDVGSVIPVIEE